MKFFFCMLILTYSSRLVNCSDKSNESLVLENVSKFINEPKVKLVLENLGVDVRRVFSDLEQVSDIKSSPLAQALSIKCALLFYKPDLDNTGFEISPDCSNQPTSTEVKADEDEEEYDSNRKFNTGFCEIQSLTNFCASISGAISPPSSFYNLTSEFSKSRWRIHQCESAIEFIFPDPAKDADSLDSTFEESYWIPTVLIVGFLVIAIFVMFVQRICKK